MIFRLLYLTINHCCRQSRLSDFPLRLTCNLQAPCGDREVAAKFKRKMSNLEKTVEKLSLSESIAGNDSSKEERPKPDDRESEGDDNGEVAPSPEVHFEPIVHLEAVETKTNEEEESVFFKIRAKLFRFDKTSGAGEWKERGTGEVKLLEHTRTSKIRLLMRRDQTLKVCANHAITSDLKLAPNVGSDRSWVYSVLADVSEGEPHAELLAIRFGTADGAKEFKAKFEEAQRSNAKLEESAASKEDSSSCKEPCKSESCKSEACCKEDEPCEEACAQTCSPSKKT